MKKVITLIVLMALILPSCSKEEEPIIVTNKRKSLRARFLSGEVYFAKIYTVTNGERSWKVEHQDIMGEGWEVGDTVGYGDNVR